MLFRSQDIEGTTWALYSFRILVVLALADISLRWVELPIRNGLLSIWVRGMKYRTKEIQTRQKTSIVAFFLILSILMFSISRNALNIANQNQKVVRDMFKEKQIAAVSQVSGLWVIGDSVILGIRNSLENIAHIGLINARVGRQAPELLKVIRHDKEKMQDSKTVLDLGNNNRLTIQEIEDIFNELKDQPLVIVVNTAVPRAWREQNNQLIADAAKNYSNIRIVDWAQKSVNHPEYFAPDGVHLIPAGIAAYVSAIREYL